MVRLLDHIWELCLLNNCHGLARYNESGCESVHKVNNSKLFCNSIYFNNMGFNTK